MPRGNDAQTAAHELADRFGSGAGNAEELIVAHDAARPRELVAASMKPLDEEATAELELDKLKGPNGEPVVSASVRGGEVIVAYEDEDGRLHKALPSLYEEKKSRSSRSKSKAKADDASDDADNG